LKEHPTPDTGTLDILITSTTLTQKDKNLIIYQQIRTEFLQKWWIAPRGSTVTEFKAELW